MKKKAASGTRIVVDVLVLALFLASVPALAQEGNEPVGTWRFTVDTGIPGVPPLLSLVSFQKGGTLVETNATFHTNSEALDPVCGCNFGTSLGAWSDDDDDVRFTFNQFIFAGPETDELDLNLSEPIVAPGQHIGYGIVQAEGTLRGDRLVGMNLARIVNLDGDDINPDFPPATQTFEAQRIRAEP